MVVILYGWKISSGGSNGDGAQGFQYRFSGGVGGVAIQVFF